MRNFYLEDPGFVARIRRLLGSDYASSAPLLERMGALAAGEVDRLAALANAHPPELQRYDREGERIDEVVFHPSYLRLREIAYGEGLVALAYGERRAPHALVFALGYIFAQGEQGLYCPVCMTDGAARVLERFAPPEIARPVIERLASRDPGTLWEGAMWLTEKQGGSDVGASATRAREEGGSWRLTGEKWFCSNAGAEVMLVLARPEGAPPGTEGLGLFLVRRHRPDGSRNAIRFHRLKDKLGTRSMATAEAALEGAEATLIAPPGRGFKAMAEMLNLSRLYNAVASCAVMRRATSEAVRHARTRTAFGRALDRHPLHQEVLADLIVETEAATALTFDAIRRLDRLDRGTATERDRRLLRALTPLTKLATAKAAVSVASEALEGLGGNGYVEEFVTPRLLRDAQVLPIWEGTTNILSLDLFERAIRRERAHEAVLEEAAELLGHAPAELDEPARIAREALEGLVAEIPRLDSRAARNLALRLAGAFAAALLVADAGAACREGGGAREVAIATRHALRHVAPRPPSGALARARLDDATYDLLAFGAEG